MPHYYDYGIDKAATEAKGGWIRSDANLKNRADFDAIIFNGTLGNAPSKDSESMGQTPLRAMAFADRKSGTYPRDSKER